MRKQSIASYALIIFLMINICKCRCPDNCIDCDQVGSVCYACANSYEISVLGDCVLSTKEHCIIYGPNEICLFCQPTYTIQGKFCVKDYSGCILFNHNTYQCQECGFGTILAQNKCIGKFFCKNWSNECLECQKGYTLVNGNCFRLENNCQTVSENGLCKNCKVGYSLEGYQCINKNLLIQNCYITLVNQTCLICKYGYKVREGNCILNSKFNQDNHNLSNNDINFNNNMNKNQISSTYSSNNSPILVNQNFNNYNNINSVIVNLSQNCLVFNPLNTSQCLICNELFYLLNGQCKQVSFLCKDYHPITGVCFSCKYGLVLLPNGSCMDKNCIIKDQNNICTQCTNNYKLNSNNICQQNDINCLSYKNQLCIECKQLYYLSTNKKCQLLQPSCQYVYNGVCLNCAVGYSLIKCVSNSFNGPIIDDVCCSRRHLQINSNNDINYNN